ncbi:MAG TPA: prolyl oligopeptidase family serine peptidase [Steroidobacteraceae bacterium]|nr:prolyl oligopeptidase family serine peptidase [Steroidobacteraceae bacterium]
MPVPTPRFFALLASLCFAAAGGLSARAQDSGATATPQQEVKDTYHGVAVVDPYRWLENANDPKVHAWSLAQDARSRTYLDGLAVRQPIFDQLMKQISATSSRYYALYAAGGKVFALLNQPPKQQPMIVVMESGADPLKARIVVNPNVLNDKGTTAIDWFVPSPDGRLVAVSLSDNGSEDGTLHIFDVASGKQVSEVIARVQYPTGGGSLAWRADSAGFWYTRYPGPDRPAQEQHFFQEVYFHRLGDDPAMDTYVLGKGFPKVAEISLKNRGNPHLILVMVGNGDGGEYAHFVIYPDNHSLQLTHFEDKVVAATVAADGTVYLVSHKDALRGKLLSLTLEDPILAHAKLLVPESEAVIQPGGEFGGEPVVVTAGAIYVRELLGGPARVAIFDHDGHPKGNLPLPEASAVEEVEPVADGSLLYSIETYLRPPYFARFDEKTGKTAETALAQTSPVSFADAEVVREFASSKDGTRIPLNIVRRKGTKLDGSNPVLLNGYGGFALSMTPEFLGPSTRLWLDAGGVFVIANLRGGGEFGEQWHEAGELTRKQNVFDDFIASAQYLIAQKYTAPERLAIIGGSNGGLLMGAALTQRPDLFRAVVSRVGIYDMLRVELDPNGAFNTTEYGSVKDPGQFKALYAYSPYHHVNQGTAYPAIFMATGETDGRVNPAHSRKMIARLQAAAAPGRPVYLSINSHAGHGIGSALSIRVNLQADTYAFLFDQLGMRLPGNAPSRP